LVQTPDGKKSYILAPYKVKAVDVIVSGENADPKIGNSLPLHKLPSGTSIHAIELDPGRGAVLARSAGTYGVYVGKEGKYAIVKLPSGEVRKILGVCRATVGTTSNGDHNKQVLGKAGRKRWLGRRPRVRGVAMNPVDHPMGGGEIIKYGAFSKKRTLCFS